MPKSRLEFMNEICPTFAMKYGFLKQRALCLANAERIYFKESTCEELEAMFEAVFNTYLKEKEEKC